VSARLREALKSAAIVLLLALMVYLTAVTWFYDVDTLPAGLRGAVMRAADALGMDTGDAAVEIMGSRAETYGEAVTPVSCAVTWTDGRAAVTHDSFHEAHRFFVRMSPLLGEAVGSAGELRAVSRPAWQNALKNEGVYFELSDAEPLSLFALGLGVSTKDEAVVSSLLMQPDGDSVKIYIASAESVFSASTSASGDALRDTIAEFAQGTAGENWQSGCLFSFERGISGENLLCDESPSVRLVNAAAPNVSDSAFGTLLSAFGINPMTNYRYTTSDGSRRAVDGTRSIELTADGVLIYRDAGGEDSHGAEIDCASDALLIEGARRIAEATAGSLAGEGKITLRDYSRSGADGSVSFGYTVGGMPVYVDGSSAAVKFEIEDGTVVRAELRLRRYSAAEERITLIPERRAQVIGGAVSIGCRDDGDELMTPAWLSRAE